jgi:hypothetical protein
LKTIFKQNLRTKYIPALALAPAPGKNFDAAPAPKHCVYELKIVKHQQTNIL